MAGRGRHAAGGRGNRQRTIAIVVVLALMLLALGGGFVLARGGGDDPAASGAGTPTATPSRSHGPKPSPSNQPSTPPSSTPTTDPDTLPDGRSFVYAKALDDAAVPATFTFDLAEFLTDQAAADAATAHGDESPPANGYYIVNDNPRLRTMPLAPTVQIRYIPPAACCSLRAGTLDGFAAAVNGAAMTDYPDMSYSPWWVTVQGGVIVKISQQYLP